MLLALSLCLLTAAAICLGPVAAGSGEDVRTNGERTNETGSYVDPDEYSESGDRNALRAALSDVLALRLETAVDELERGEYEAAEAVVDDVYRVRVEQYRTIVDATGGYDSEDRPVDEPTPTEAFDRAGIDLRTLITALEAYDETQREYERAIERGDEETGLDRARELDVLAADVAAANESVQKQVAAADPVTDVDLDASSDRLETVDRRIQRELADVRSSQFETTTMTADADADAVSVTDSITVSGTVRVENESRSDDETDRWPADDPLVVEINGNGHELDDHDDGRFSVEYRPRPLAPAVDELRVRYRPSPGVDNVGSEATVPVSIEPIEPSLELESTDEVAYGETASYAVHLTAGDDAVDGAPITVSLGDTELETVTTVDGTATGEVTVPASVPAGERELSARVAVDERAIEPAVVRNQVTVRERETRLGIGSARLDDGIRVGGVLTTADGTPVRDQPVVLSVDETSVVVTTGEDGRFDETVSTSTSDEELTVNATYDGAHTNLASTSAETSVGGQRWGTLSFLPAGPVIALVVCLVVGGVLVGVWALGRFTRGPDPLARFVRSRIGPVSQQRRSIDERAVLVEESDEPNPVDDREPTDAGDSSSGDGRVDDTSRRVDELLDRASDHVSRGRPNEGVRLAYTAVRLALRSTIDDDRTNTHWEFRRRYSGPHEDELAHITEQYERAAFGRETVTEEVASDVLLDAYALVKLVDADASDDLEEISVER
ncbi:hypothetical protein EA472_07220 [Natrarchaeobius oligotrophus]|uniref:Protein-glutamine gamma-glutamyltransferase-like C-terminal domain-containing protein n=1 Tax=Natrarchaeobius chitinivorans TaxID=1679083 RepID=A0A3N6N171_NATCH|nr:hypothetical protein EA472_07220 [Natrarchaeobius chitinivorans]